MPNQNDPTQNPNPAVPPVSQPADQAATPPVPPIIFPQSDLPPLSPEFQNLPETSAAAGPADQPSTPPVIGNAGSSAPPDISSVTPKAKKKFGGGKIIATILGLVVLVGGVAAGIILTQQQQLFKQKAATTACSGCGDAPDPLPTFNQAPTQVGPFTATGNLIIYYVGLGSKGARTVNITTSGGGHVVNIDTQDKSRIVTNITVNTGETITINGIEGPNQGNPACAPVQGPPYPDLGWMPVNSDTTCGTGLNGPPTNGQCTPMGKPNVASAISWAQGFNDASFIGKQCWADWREWPGDYDFNDFFLMFGVSAAAPTPTPPPLVCGSECNPSNDTCPGLSECIIVEPPNGYACRNPGCEWDADCVCGTSVPSPTPPGASPTPTPPPPAPYCVAVTTYRTNATSTTTSVTGTTETTGTSGVTWTLIPESERPLLKAGDTVYFCVAGYGANGTFDKARFTITRNGSRGTPLETTTKRPGSSDFCKSYTIPAGTTSINVKGEIHDSIYGWFGGISID